MNVPINSANGASAGALILIVDDELDLLSAFAMLLEQLGYQIRTASNGREALACALSERPDIVVSDFMMPTMDGAQLCRELRANPALSSVPFILCSAGRLPARSFSMVRHPGRHRSRAVTAFEDLVRSAR